MAANGNLGSLWFAMEIQTSSGSGWSVFQEQDCRFWQKKDALKEMKPHQIHRLMEMEMRSQGILQVPNR